MSKAIKITNGGSNNIAPLFCQYDGQCQPQTAYLTFDPRDGEAEWDWDGEIGNGVPMDIWHDVRRRWSCCERLSESQITALSELMKPLLVRVADGHDTEWDGSNWRGVLTNDAAAASEAIDAILRETAGDVQVYESGEYLDENSWAQLLSECVADTPETIAEELFDALDNVMIVGGRDALVETLQEMKEESEEEAEEE